MAEQDLFHFRQIDLVTADVEERLLAARHDETAALVELSDIASIVETVAKHRGVDLRPIVVAVWRDRRALDPYLVRLAPHLDR